MLGVGLSIRTAKRIAFCDVVFAAHLTRRGTCSTQTNLWTGTYIAASSAIFVREHIGAYTIARTARRSTIDGAFAFGAKLIGSTRHRTTTTMLRINVGIHTQPIAESCSPCTLQRTFPL